MKKVNVIKIFRTCEGKNGILLERRYDCEPLSVGDIIESFDGSYETDAYANFVVIQCSNPFTCETDGNTIQVVEVKRITPYSEEDLSKLENAANRVYFDYYQIKETATQVCEDYIKAALTWLNKPLEIHLAAPDMKSNIVSVKLNRQGEIIGIRENGKEINYSLNYRTDLIELSARIQSLKRKRS